MQKFGFVSVFLALWVVFSLSAVTAQARLPNQELSTDYPPHFSSLFASLLTSHVDSMGRFIWVEEWLTCLHDQQSAGVPREEAHDACTSSLGSDLSTEHPPHFSSFFAPLLTSHVDSMGRFSWVEELLFCLHDQQSAGVPREEAHETCTNTLSSELSTEPSSDVPTIPVSLQVYRAERMGGFSWVEELLFCLHDQQSAGVPREEAHAQCIQLLPD